MINNIKDILTLVIIALIASVTIIIGLVLVCLIYPLIICTILGVVIIMHLIFGTFICAIPAYMSLLDFTWLNIVILAFFSLLVLEIILSH